MKESVAIAKEEDRKKDFSPTWSGNSIQRLRDEPERQPGSLRSVIDNIRHDGGTPSVDSIATELSSMHSAERAPVLLALQRTHGNRYVQRVVTGIQAKLAVGQPGDIYEQEADRVEDAVMRMPEPQVQRQPEEEEEREKLSIQARTITPTQALTLQRQDDEEEEELKKKKKEEEEEELIMAKGILGKAPEVSDNLQTRLNQLKSGGQPLSESVCAFFEPRFGYDFNQVRVHTDSTAASVAHELNAQAFTRGHDIFWGTGRYRPETVSGKRLLAHELTHVVQQGAAPLSRKSAETKDKAVHDAEKAQERIRRPEPAQEHRNALPSESAALDQLLGDIHIPVDANTDKLANKQGAKAFATSNDIFFREGAYRPGSESGKALLGQELAHVIQDEGGTTSSAVQERLSLVGKEGDAFEMEAEAAGQAVASSPLLNVQPGLQVPSVQKQEAEGMVIAKGELTEEELKSAIKYNIEYAREFGKGRIAQVQRFLRVKDTDTMDSDTVKAIARWQANNGLFWDGKLDQTLLRTVFPEEWAETVEETSEELVIDPRQLENRFDRLIIKANDLAGKVSEQTLHACIAFEAYVGGRIKELEGKVTATRLFITLMDAAAIPLGGIAGAGVILSTGQLVVDFAIERINESVDKSKLKVLGIRTAEEAIKKLKLAACDAATAIQTAVEKKFEPIIKNIVEKAMDWQQPKIADESKLDFDMKQWKLIEIFYSATPDETTALLESHIGIPGEARAKDIQVQIYQGLVRKFEEFYIYEVEALEIKSYGERTEARIWSEAEASRRSQLAAKKRREELKAAEKS